MFTNLTRTRTEPNPYNEGSIPSLLVTYRDGFPSKY